MTTFNPTSPPRRDVSHAHQTKLLTELERTVTGWTMTYTGREIVLTTRLPVSGEIVTTVAASRHEAIRSMVMRVRADGEREEGRS